MPFLRPGKTSAPIYFEWRCLILGGLSLALSRTALSQSTFVRSSDVGIPLADHTTSPSIHVDVAALTDTTGIAQWIGTQGFGTFYENCKQTILGTNRSLVRSVRFIQRGDPC